ncbi:MAG: M1 family metallopeptidase [Myxococcota bacterium]|nr:M1 family metallopeptidase [Myxococcota bacterium]
MRSHAEDVADYTLVATLDAAGHTVHGEGTIAWRNTSSVPVSELWLHLYLNAFKNERSAFFRERVGGRGSAKAEDWGCIDVRRLVLAGPPAIDLWRTAELRRPGDEDETDARVPLAAAVQPGQQILLQIEFDEKLPAIVERTGYRGSFHMIGQWFPKIARLEPDGRWAHFAFHHLAEFYADFGTYDVTLDVPESFTIGATGALIESRVQGGRRRERHIEHDIHDFAWTAWDKFQTARATIDDVKVTLLYPRGFAGVVSRELDALRFALPYFGARYGRYPYGELTVVHPQEDAAEAGGMEYPTLITSAGAWWLPAAILEPEIVTVHELGHQWFYGMIATDELSWPFLDEGLNQFAEVDAVDNWRGAGSLLNLWGLRVSDGALQAVGGNRAVQDETIAQPANAFSTGANYGRLVYARTASVMSTLARVYGPRVFRALGIYARRFRFEHPGPEQLIAVFEEQLGKEVAANLRNALFAKGWVDYTVEVVTTREADEAAGIFDRDGRRETIASGRERGSAGSWENSVLVRRRGTLSFPVEIELSFADGSTSRRQWDGRGEWMRFTWTGDTPIRGAVVDPDGRVLIDGNVANNRGATPDGAGSTLRILQDATYWMQLAIQSVAP